MGNGAWEIKERNRVHTVILHCDQVSIAWAVNFRRLAIPGPDPILIAGLPFDHARNAGTQMALERGAEWVFHLDSDVLPPPDAVHRLLAHNRPFISGMYCRRSPPHAVPVMMRNHQWVTELPADPVQPLIEVELVGAGCMLIHRSVFEKLPPHRPGKPWFDWRVDLQGHVPVGSALSEDFTLCRAVRQHLGIPVIVDTSVRCGHVGMARADYGSFTPLVA